jgi:hypothetical protein
MLFRATAPFCIETSLSLQVNAFGDRGEETKGA